MVSELPNRTGDELPYARPRKAQYPHKTSFYQQEDDAKRMRAVFLNTRLETGFNSLSDFINAAVDEKILELEKVHNEGWPWQPLGARQIPQGKPAGLPAANREMTQTREGPQMPKHPAKELVDLVEKVRGELDEKFTGGRGEVNVFYRDDGLQALVETYDIGNEVSAVSCYEFHPALQVIDVRTSDGIAWEEGGSIPPSV